MQKNFCKKIQALKAAGLIGVIGIFAIAGCASIPGEAPELSAQLGQRIMAIEKANIQLLRSFFDEKRRQVDKFIMEEWVPTFAEEIFAEPLIDEVWEEVVRTNNKEDRLQLFVRLGPKLQKRINSKRIELVQPLDELERTIERRLREEYDQAKAINNSLTSFLASAAEVAENRNRYLGAIGVTDEKMTNAIQGVDTVVSQLLQHAGTAQDLSKDEKVQKYLEKIKNLFNQLQG